jgi:hypothetical protein
MMGNSWQRTALNHVNKEQMSVRNLMGKYSDDGYNFSLKPRYGNSRFFWNKNKITERITNVQAIVVGG